MHTKTKSFICYLEVLIEQYIHGCTITKVCKFQRYCRKFVKVPRVKEVCPIAITLSLILAVCLSVPDPDCTVCKHFRCDKITQIVFSCSFQILNKNTSRGGEGRSSVNLRSDLLICLFVYEHLCWQQFLQRDILTFTCLPMIYKTYHRS